MANVTRTYPETKIIDGKRFTKMIGVFTKKAAIDAKKRYHTEGYLVRVIKHPRVSGYAVYIRGLGYR